MWLCPLLFSLLFLRLSSLFCCVATAENEPNSLVEGVVSVITGDFYALEEDIVIQGAEPLTLKRCYIGLRGKGSWSFCQHATAVCNRTLKFLKVREPNGTILTYAYDSKEETPTFFLQHLKTKGLTNTGRGILSGQTNLKNQRIEMEKDWQAFTLFSPQGTRRIYRLMQGKKLLERPLGLSPDGNSIYLLDREELPSGNKILYSWDKYGRLTSIATKDPSEKKSYAEARLTYQGKVKKQREQPYLQSRDFTVETSDGRELQYRYFSDGEKTEKVWYLEEIRSKEAPWSAFHYLPRQKSKHRLLHEACFPDGRIFKIDYYPISAEKFSGYVKTLHSPVGNGLQPIRQFVYEPGSRKTIVTDIQGVSTVYFWNEQTRLYRIDRLTSKGKLHSREIFTWEEESSGDTTRLLSKALRDESGELIRATGYLYDEFGNVIEEHFYGHLTGQASSELEVCVKKRTYSQEGKNLLLKKEEPSGLTVTYSYLPGTSLILSKLYSEKGVIKKRVFYQYNRDHLLTGQLLDNGSHSDRDNLTGVTTRLIKTYSLKSDQPFLGMPELIEESYWDGQRERLLKKTRLHYTTGGRISLKEVYDETGALAYQLTYAYDEMGRLIQESNALGQLAKSKYDDCGNKVFFQDFGAKKVSHMSYDHSHCLIESKEESPEGLFITRYSYDQKGNKVASLDPHGYETSYFYDEWGHPIQTCLPPLDGMLSVTEASYDAAGRIVRYTDGNDHTTCTTYNAYDKPILVSHPDGTEEKWSYHPNGTLKTYIDRAGQETHYIHDAFQRVTEKKSWALGKLLSEESWSYNGLNLISYTDSQGTTTLYFYDGAGRKIEERSPGKTTLFTYDSLGRLHTRADGKQISRMTYDLLGRMIKKTKCSPSGEPLSSSTYTYDFSGNLSTLTHTTGEQKRQESFEYDSLGRLICKKDSTGLLTRVTQVIYNDALHQKTTIDPENVQTIETFNSHYKLKSVKKLSPKGELLYKERLFYDANDNVIRKRSGPPDQKVTTLWEYDSMNQIVQITEAPALPSKSF